jgi:hypothetical protein
MYRFCPANTIVLFFALDGWCFQPQIDAPKDCATNQFASMLCADFGPSPRVAVCLGGGARTFVNPLVFESIRENLLGGSLGAKHIDLFAHLKLAGHRGANDMLLITL